MCNVRRVRWTITPKFAPEPWLACSGCGNPRPFRSSGKIRLNANGRKLDAWLIYKCRDCDKTWNRSLFERRSVVSIRAADLEALQSNDPVWVRRHEFDIAGLRGKAQQIDECADVAVLKEAINGEEGDRLEIMFVVPVPVGMRLDRLLAAELGLSRAELQTLHKDSRLWVNPVRKDALRRKIAHGTCVILEAVMAARP